MNIPDHDIKTQYVILNNLQEHSATYSSAVGFDLIKCRVFIQSIKWDQLNNIIKKSSGVPDYQSLKAEDHIRYTIAGGNNKPLNIYGNNENGNYASIMIEYKDFSLRLLSANIKKKGDVNQLIVHVSPQIDVLGNMNNASAEIVKKRVRAVIRCLKSKFGIILDETVATINYFELNRNYAYDGKGFIEFFEAAFCSLPDRFCISPKKTPWGSLGVVDNLGIFANSSTVQLHVYNKLLETEENSQIFLYVEAPTVYRVEFVVTKKKQVESWLSTSNVFELKQDKVEEAYFKYLKKYAIDPFDQQYKLFYEFIIGLEDIYDTSKRHWTDEFANRLIFYAPRFHLDPIFITPDEVKKMLKERPAQTKTIEQNLNRCVNSIIEKTNLYIDGENYETKIKNLLLSTEEPYEIKYYFNPKSPQKK